MQTIPRGLGSRIRPSHVQKLLGERGHEICIERHPLAQAEVIPQQPANPRKFLALADVDNLTFREFYPWMKAAGITGGNTLGQRQRSKTEELFQFKAKLLEAWYVN